MYFWGPFSCNTLYQSAFLRLLYLTGKLLKFTILEGANRYMQCFLKPLIKASTFISVHSPWVKASHKAKPLSQWSRDVCSTYWERRVGSVNLILHRHVFSCRSEIFLFALWLWVCLFLLFFPFSDDISWSSFHGSRHKLTLFFLRLKSSLNYANYLTFPLLMDI